MTEEIQQAEETAPVEETTLDELSRVYDEMVEQGTGRLRDERGRFAPKATDGGMEEETQVADPEPESEPEKLDLSRLGFNPEERAALEKLPPEALQALATYNDRRNSGIAPLRQKAEIADSFINTLQPHADYLKALQVAPEDFIGSMLATEKTLRLGNQEQKINMLQRLAHEYDIQLQGLSETPFDPALARLQQQLDYRERQLSEMQRSQQAAQSEGVTEYVSRWAQGKEYFDALREPMANLLSAGLATDLDEAYNKALRLDDNLYAQQQKKQQAILADQKARKAMSSSVQVRNNATTGANIPAFTNTLDELRYRADQMGY